MMNDDLIRVEDAVVNLLSGLEQETVGRETIAEKVRVIAGVQGINDEESIAIITGKVEERFDIHMPMGTIFQTEEYRPWLADEKINIEWYYWERYRRYLSKKKFPPNVVWRMGYITDQILDHLENPYKEGSWSRKGLVVGNVQSGKTSNYIGLINKAADCGYRVIIVLAGMINSLRNQTQERVDRGFIGRCSEKHHDVGVGSISKEKIPAYFTTGSRDFNKRMANQIGVTINNLKEPAVLVVKKNPSTLKNLIEWMQYNNPHNLKDNPMLLIDDEADHASINTKKDPDEATTINKRIRELIKLFPRSSYVGYTATPFANVFIDPDTESDMWGDDLFPRDFIFSLEPPDNYTGPDKIFSDEPELNIVREVSDFSDIFPLKHKKELSPDELPESLKNAIICFILARALRLLRGQIREHHSMMINVSRFTAVQNRIKYLVDQYLKELTHSISNYCMLSTKEALKNSMIERIKEVWEKEYADVGYTWKEVQSKLNEAASPITVIEVNSSRSSDRLDYSEHNYPNGRSVITVGGLSLSRGLTLEGLITTYFLRNSIMYDTLMQMGRWFGYRDGYNDLCRIFMTPDAFSWYAHISDATNELRNEFRRMKKAGMTPKDFGLCVRSHPESLIVTARNKMRTGVEVTRKINLEGNLVETAALLTGEKAVESNMKALETLMQKMGQWNPSEKPSGYIWKDASYEHISWFIHEFCNHPASQLTEAVAVINYINQLRIKGMDKWDVVLISPRNNQEYEKPINGLEVRTESRKVTKIPIGVRINKHRVGDAQQEKAGLPESEVEKAEAVYKDETEREDGKCAKNIPGAVYRKLRVKLRSNPLMILHILDCRNTEGNLPCFKKMVAYGLSFPGGAGIPKNEGLVKYMVNIPWFKSEYGDLIEDDDEENDE
ncbi:Z1 domain-containing protein [Candidatus Omnitrophota bacterium]